MAQLGQANMEVTSPIIVTGEDHRFWQRKMAKYEALKLEVKGTESVETQKA